MKYKEFKEDEIIPPIPEYELYKINDINKTYTDEFMLDYNFKVLKEKINQLTYEFNKFIEEESKNEK